MSYALFDSQMKDKIIIDNDDLPLFTAFYALIRPVPRKKNDKNDEKRCVERWIHGKE